ncbi:type II CAAX endopeptidase family protein [Verrucomicrobiales bacterium BCK34]|nr:type II CAAX endopeptidase family protein [Verrucomicrobiales bacterium BCK34]
MDSPSFFRSTAFKIAVFLAGTVVIGAILAPFLYWGGKYVVSEEWLKGGILDSINGSMERGKFPRYFNRSILAGALIMLWPTLKWLNAGGTKKKQSIYDALLLKRDPRWWKDCLIGFLIAAISLLALGWFYVAQGWYVTGELTKSIPSILVSALITGFAVGFLEEFVFRGALHAVLAKLLKPKVLFTVIAVFFALIHFFNAPKTLEVPDITATSGFWMVGAIFKHFFSQFANPYFLFAEFAVLLAIGLILGYTRMKTRSLWLGIGLHAGWVFGVKTLSSTTSRAFGPAEMMPWLGDSLRVGAVSCIVLCLTGAVIVVWLRKRPGRAFSETQR